VFDLFWSPARICVIDRYKRSLILLQIYLNFLLFLILLSLIVFLSRLDPFALLISINLFNFIDFVDSDSVQSLKLSIFFEISHSAIGRNIVELFIQIFWFLLIRRLITLIDLLSFLQNFIDQNHYIIRHLFSVFFDFISSPMKIDFIVW